jgi:hypothetical protein
MTFNPLKAISNPSPIKSGLTQQAYNPSLHPGGLGSPDIKIPVDGPAKPVLNKGLKFQSVKGKNLTGVKQDNHFAISWDFTKGGEQTGVFNRKKYDLVLGKDIAKVPARFRRDAGIVHKASGKVEFYNKTPNGPLYSLFDPKTGKVTQQTKAPVFLPDDVSKLQGGKRINLDG